jgi:hypothetical protein
MKKQLLAAAITAAVMAGNAQAALPVIASDTTVVYLSGASASLDYINKLITSSAAPAVDRFCDSTQEIWRFNDQIDGKSQNAFYCTTAQTNTSLKNKVKSHLLIYKRSEGGSAMGVSPLVINQPISFLNITSNPTCTVATQAVAGTTVGAATCTYDKTLATASQFTLKTPDFGMSDLEPGKFTGENTPDGFSAITADDVATLTIAGASAVTFGEPVTLQLFKALQAAQKATGQIPASCAIGDKTEACLPNLTSAQIASIHTGSWTSWNSLKVGNTGLGLYDWVSANASAYLPAVSDVHVCRRTNGSGTQAQHGVVFLNSPCSEASAATQPAHDLGGNEGDGFTMVHEMAESGGVTNCLHELDTATDAANAFNNSAWKSGVRWAVGIQSLEKTDANFEFVKVDGVAPTLAHVVDGSYHDWVENTFQYNTSYYNGRTPDVKALITAVIQKAALPEVIATLNNGFVHGFGTGAYLAVPSLFAPEANGAFNSARPVNPYSRATVSVPVVDNCRVPTIWNGGDAKL